MSCKTCGDRRTVHYAESTCQPAHEGPCPSCVGVTIATVPVGAVSGSAEDLREALERAKRRLPYVTIDAMGGDNLAVTLCSHFDDGEGEEDENGWTQAASDGCDETLAAIHHVYAAALTEGQQS